MMFCTWILQQAGSEDDESAARANVAPNGITSQNAVTNTRWNEKPTSRQNVMVPENPVFKFKHSENNDVARPTS